MIHGSKIPKDCQHSHTELIKACPIRGKQIDLEVRVEDRVQ